MDLAPANTALGEFLVLSVLGQGGSGVVYDAQWGPRRVALKVVHPTLVGTERIRTQFLAEARRLQTITHAAVVKVLAVGELPDGRPYLAMERLEGETLASMLARGPLELAEAMAMFGELCGAVVALHEQSLVHRDLKPENIFVVGGKHAVLLDFGIAKELEAPASTTTMDGGVRGTPAYMAPERFFGQPAGVATDIYELAVTLYAMLAGCLPWDDVADPESRLSPRPLVDLVPVPAELDVEIRRAMSTRAQNRPGTAQALLAAVKTAAGGSASGTEPPKPADTARMAPAGAKTTAGGVQKPWFAERQVTTDRGKTPLAWAPSPAKTEEPPRRNRKRLALYAGIAGAAAIAVALIIWQLAGNDAKPAPPPLAAALVGSGSAVPIVVDAAVAEPDAYYDPDDPWSAQPEPVREIPGALATSGDEVPQDVARKEIAAAIRHVPADSHLVFTAAIGELRKHEQIDDVLGKIAKQPLVKAFLASTPPCIQTLVTGAEWAIFATKAIDARTSGTLMIRGRWQRADVEACFAPDAMPLAMPDGKKMMQLKRVGWVDFVDDHTIYISVREDLAAAQVHELVLRGNGPSPTTAKLLATIPAARSIGVVIDGSDGLPWPNDMLPKKSDLVAWLRAGEPTEFLVVADTHNTKSAAALVAKVRPTFDEVFKDSQSSLIGNVKVVHDKTRMKIEGQMTALLIAMISSQIP